MILSFAWTTPAVAVYQKTETRRDWSPKQIALALKVMRERRPVDAWRKSPRFGGEKFGTVLIRDIVEQECASTIPDEAWEAEGFHVLTALRSEFAKGSQAPDVWRHWRHSEPGTNLQTVVRFEVLSLTPLGVAIQRSTNALLEIDRPVTLSRIREATKGMDEWRLA